MLSGSQHMDNAKQEQQVFGDVVDISTQLREFHITLYTVDPLGTSGIGSRALNWEPYLKGWGAGDAGPSEIAQQMETELEIENSAEIIRFLDTEESLREAVRLFDGSPRIAKYENAFLKTILESSHRDLAVPLLANRMADHDFLASVDFIDMLTAMTIQVEEPIAFDRDDLSSQQQLNSRTLEILRGYVLALGHSLPSKRTGVREVGIATFEHYASKEYCASEPLIEKRMADQIRLQVRSKLEN